eukprot:CAMPEP_0194063082 /NCGR_PEP_ID=MMETSP0009_2-20130614/79391_1 /TAXON_ID=210454 /ORGANISM="Grammatophora oceanica, Strain CCMP 410" /LENGTH=52 /DNA_ID=CAMNT_0038715067 /DNA_START=10 /DNA_END=168 /DNA_ORIENTATION=-
MENTPDRSTDLLETPGKGGEGPSCCCSVATGGVFVICCDLVNSCVNLCISAL